VLDSQQAQDGQVLVRLRARALGRVDEATMLRTKRSCPGTSMTESRRPSGSSSGA
jgi:hypothetical protein